MRLPVRLAILLGLLSTLPGCYIVQQGLGQLGMLSQREPIARVLQEPHLPIKTRDRLMLVWYARRFARDVLGLRVGQSYQDLVWLDRDAASYVVAAAPPDSLEPYRWCFPVVGCQPYIGYFNRADAVRERKRLIAQGYDVSVRGVAAYSLGGWIPDPVYSSMLSDSRWGIANTVIHELTHGTVFVPGEASFNEGVATFIGDRGAMLFLERHFGAQSRTVADARDEWHDVQVYSEFLYRLAGQLRDLYASGLPRAEKLRLRKHHFSQASERIARLPLRTVRYLRLGRRVLNNAFLATHVTYFGSEARFEAVYDRLGRDLPRFVAFIRDEVGRQSDPDAYLVQWLERTPPRPNSMQH
jgi:predicted aminopeptidase